MRRHNQVLNSKFVDYTRHFFTPPTSYNQIELWVEKDSIANFLGNLAAKYRLSVQSLRGFASLSMFRKALQRAKKRGVTELLYIGDHDASGLLIDRIAQKEMGVSVHRIALTMNQIRHYRLPSIPVNLDDSRARDYIAKYGACCWELEALRPRTFQRLVEEELKKHVPKEFLAEAEVRDQASRMSKPLSERLRRMLEEDSFKLLKLGKSKSAILAQLAVKYGFLLQRNLTT
jgi:hypothetical protein